MPAIDFLFGQGSAHQPLDPLNAQQRSVDEPEWTDLQQIKGAPSCRCQAAKMGVSRSERRGAGGIVWIHVMGKIDLRISSTCCTVEARPTNPDGTEKDKT